MENLLEKETNFKRRKVWCITNDNELACCWTSFIPNEIPELIYIVKDYVMTDDIYIDAKFKRYLDGIKFI